MIIQLQKPHGVITEITSASLPPFAVLIGPNGAGKSHLFRGLINEHFTIQGIAKEDIQLFDVSSFTPQGNSTANRQSNEIARKLIDDYFAIRSGSARLSEVALSVFEETVQSVPIPDKDSAREAVKSQFHLEMRSVPRMAIYGLNPVNNYTAQFLERVLRPLHTLDSARDYRGREIDISNSQRMRLFTAALRTTDKMPHELTSEDISNAIHYDSHLVANLLSTVFTTYKLDQYSWAHKQVEEGDGKTYRDLLSEYQVVHPPPWSVMREVLEDMRETAGNHALFDFDFTDPQDLDLNMGNFEFFNFSTVMTNRTTGATYDPTELSSGEKTLMALCMVSFNQYVGQRKPKLLLMDEVDAMLHPSMVKALVRTFKVLFVSKGIPVLLISHSPMTVATLLDGEIFSVERHGRRVEIQSVSKSDAISQLSEGLATVDVGLRIAASAESPITILTEGNNARHLRRWAELFFPGEVTVFQGLEEHTSAEQLLVYGRLLAKLQLDTHFIIVWDCDAHARASELQAELTENSGVTPFAFNRQAANSIATKGIENNYDNEFLEEYAVTVNDVRGNVIARNLDGRRKSELANFISDEGTREHFVNFADLNDLVGRILAEH